MSTTQTNIQALNGSWNTNQTDADTVQTLEQGDIIEATELTKEKHDRYIDAKQINDNTDVTDYAERTIKFVVTKTPDPDEHSVFAAQLIKLRDYHDELNTNDLDAYNDPEDDEPETWNITSPTLPDSNNQNNVTMTRMGKKSHLIARTLENIENTDHTPLNTEN